MHIRALLTTPRTLANAALLASYLGLGAGTSLAHADIITVCPDGSCDFTSPAAAVDAAVEGDTIQIAAGTYMLASPLSLYDKDLVIRGAVDAKGRPATILNAQNATYHINALIQTAATVIENLVLTNGRGTSYSAIYAFNCTGMTFRNCSVRNNRAGAIGTNNSSLTMIACEILDNSAGPVPSVGGGIYVAGSISLVDCLVSGNASSFSGGGIFLPSGSVAHLTRTRVCGNSAPQSAQIGLNPGGTINNVGGACISNSCVSCPVPPACPADINGDNAVGPADLATLLSAWGGTGPSDLNGDGVVGSADITVLLSAWGACG